jgi:hypothetical protein
MPTIPFIKKRIGPSYLVWFQNSNLYLLLEEPAWFVFSKTIKKYKAETIAKEFAIRYSNTPSESLSFVLDICLKIEKMNRVDNTQKGPGLVSKDLDEHNFIPFSIHRYRLGDKVIEFSYESRYFEAFIHLLICHFETSDIKKGMPLFELFAFEERIVFRFNGEIKGEWNQDETHLVKGLIFMFLINVLHDKTNDDWLMTVHASAITNGKKTILFPAPPGYGKTTIAAQLQARGYTLISDDFVPIDRCGFKAYPFPIALSVKEGSIDLLSSLYPSLEQRPLNYITHEKSVRYLPSNHQLDDTKLVFPIKEIVFIQYDSSVDFMMEKPDIISALKQLLDQAWIAPAQVNAALFFDCIMEISFFRLTYSNNQKAMDAISDLFDHD